MVKQENMPNAYKEVYVIVNSMGQKDIDKVPKDFMNMLEENMNKDYQFSINGNEDFEHIEILQETKTLLMHLFMNYWATEEQKKRIRQKFRNDIEQEEKNKGKYNSNELFNKVNKKKFKQNINNNNNKNENENLNENSIVKVNDKKESIFMKLSKFIIKLLKKKE